MGLFVKDSSLIDEHAFHWAVGGVTARKPTMDRGSERKVPTLVLRHGPNSYGRQQ